MSKFAYQLIKSIQTEIYLNVGHKIKQMNKKDDLYIAVLKFGKSKLGTPLLFSELESHLNKLGYDYQEFALRQLFAAKFISSEYPSGNDPNGPISQEHHFYLETHGYFDLLEHEELKSARKSSLIATWFAFGAIVVSIISTVYSIYYTNKQLNSAVSIERSQIEELNPMLLESTIIESTGNIQNELNSLNSKLTIKLDTLIDELKK